MAFKTLYNRLDHRDKPFEFTKPSMTLQEPKDDCDINHIVEMYCGINPRINPLLQQPFFEGEDLAALPQTLLEAYETTDTISERFAQIPSSIRRELGDSPVNMLQWISNPANRKRGEELGIFAKPVEPLGQSVGNNVANATNQNMSSTSTANNNPVTE